MNRSDAINLCYKSVKYQSQADWAGKSCAKSLKEFALLSLEFLTDDCEVIPLKSLVPNKKYIGYVRSDKPNVVSRPVNAALFKPDAKWLADNWDAWLAGKLPVDVLASMAYTAAIGPCLAMELFDRQNKKGPATYFECFIGHIFSCELGINPTKKVTLPILDRKIRMTMDFIFDATDKKIGLHLACKMSCRERVVQAWAHQRLLEVVYEGKYIGMLVSFAETKLDSKKLEVVEICVPDQWLAYQANLATIKRIYYFDIPDRYAQLAKKYPDLIHIKHFGEFFKERAEVLWAG